jgi:hypothetical protein
MFAKIAEKEDGIIQYFRNKKPPTSGGFKKDSH